MPSDQIEMCTRFIPIDEDRKKSHCELNDNNKQERKNDSIIFVVSVVVLSRLYSSSASRFSIFTSFILYYKKSSATGVYVN